MGMQIAPAPPPVTIALPATLSPAAWVVAVLFAVVAALFGVVAWFLRREIRNNDEAHKELRGDVKKLLEGDVAWVRSLLERLPRTANLE